MVYLSSVQPSLLSLTSSYFLVDKLDGFEKICLYSSPFFLFFSAHWFSYFSLPINADFICIFNFADFLPTFFFGRLPPKCNNSHHLIINFNNSSTEMVIKSSWRICLKAS